MDNCEKKHWNNKCCCNCGNHLEDFYHCTTNPRPDGVEGCVCSVHKGWICSIVFDDGTARNHSGWSEHGMCEMWIPQENTIRVNVTRKDIDTNHLENGF